MIISAFAAAWLEAYNAEWVEDLKSYVKGIPPKGGHRYSHTGEGTAFRDLEWTAVSVFNEVQGYDINWHHNDMRFSTSCQNKELIVTLHEPVPITVLIATQAGCNEIIASNDISLPEMHLTEGTTDKGLTKLVFSVGNREIN